MINWWKARKVFKRPKCHFIFGKDLWFFGLYINPKFYNPIIHFKYSSLGYKIKWDEYRHEWDPHFQIVLFRKWHFIWIFNWIDKKDKTTLTSSMSTWEAILDYNDGRSLKDCIDYHTWKSSKYGYITIEDNLKLEKMKYWICKGEDGTFVYMGNQKPIFNLDENKFESIEKEGDWDWIELKYLDMFYIKYPKNLEVGDCKRLFINVTSKW